MKARWVSRLPTPELPIVAQATIAKWWPGNYYWVSTFEMDRASPLRKLTRSLTTGTYSDEPLPQEFVTQVFRCDRHGFVKSFDDPIHQKTYKDLEGAKLGHEETVRLVELGLIRELKWTRWVAPGGAGYGVVTLLGFAALLFVAGCAIYFVRPWWAALLAAIITWYAAQVIMPILWAIVRRVIEVREGIRW